MKTCDMCFSETRNRKLDDSGSLLCTDCREYMAYWNGLTPGERRAEHESMARHVEEEERRERAEGVRA